jgi:hypothetical protein
MSVASRPTSRNEIVLDQRVHRAPAAADRIGVAMALEATGAQLHGDDLFRVDRPVPGVTHRLERQAVIRRFDAFDLHFTCASG